MNKKINIYSIDINNNHIYECSTITNLNCRQAQMKFVSNNKLLSNVLKSTNRMVHFKQPINNNTIFKNNNVVKLYASYK